MFRSEAVPRNECQVDKALNECEIPPVAELKSVVDIFLQPDSASELVIY